MSLYIYAVYWVLTAISTVGYGHASYQTSNELIYTCFLEVLATIAQAYFITSCQMILMKHQYSFQYLVYERLRQADEWLIFKIEAIEKNRRLPKHFTCTVLHSLEYSFRNDHDMIVEEGYFYQ